MKKITSNQSGISLLILVLIIALLLELVFFSTLLLSRVGSQRSASNQYSRQAYYAVEAALRDTIQIFRTDTSWPPANPFEEIYMIGDVEVTRLITYDPTTETYTISLQSSYEDVKRRIEAEYSRESEGAVQALDIILILDHSASMIEEMDETVNPESLLEQAAATFLDGLSLLPGDRVGLVSFETFVELEEPLGDFPANKSAMEVAIEALLPINSTHITHGLRVARDQLELPDPPGPPRKKIAVLFTDGVSNQRYIDPSATFPVIRGCPGFGPYGSERLCRNTTPIDTCADSASNNYYSDDRGEVCASGGDLCPTNFAPENRGTLCSDQTISLGAEMRNNLGYELYGIYFAPDIATVPEFHEFGRKIVEYTIGDTDKVYEANNPEELVDAFEAVSNEVSGSTRETFSFHEVEPLPD